LIPTVSPPSGSLHSTEAGAPKFSPSPNLQAGILLPFFHHAMINSNYQSRSSESQTGQRKHHVVRRQELEYMKAKSHFRGDCYPSNKEKGKGSSSPSLSRTTHHTVLRQGNPRQRTDRSYQPLSKDPSAALGGRLVKQGQSARGSVHTSRICRFDDRCWYKHLHCPFRHTPIYLSLCVCVSYELP